MQPSISKFPNSNFYSKISDGPNVICKTYEKHYLPGAMYGSYSFINIERGKEATDKNGKRWKNMIEVAVVLHIVKDLFEGTFIATYILFHIPFNLKVIVVHVICNDYKRVIFVMM